MAQECGAVFFLHVPKTAGTSLRRVFEHHYPPPGLVLLYPPFDDVDLERVRVELRSGGKVVYGHLTFAIREALGVPGKFVTLLRHPVERVASYFRHNLGHANSEHHEVAQSGITLAEFVDRRITHETNNHMTRILAGHPGRDPLDDDRVLERALHNLENEFLFAGLAERFDESLHIMGDRLGWTTPFPEPIPRLNLSPVHSPAEPDPTARDIILRHNRLDLALYEAVERGLADELPHEEG
jgi:hypothetical protein